MMSMNERHIFWKNDRALADARFYDIFYKNRNKINEFIVSLNTTLCFLFVELNGRANLGEGALDFKVYEAEDVFIVNPQALEGRDSECEKFFSRPIHSIFTELGFDKIKPIREQEPKPLPDRKALDDIVFDALGLTAQERKEVYWAVAELVQNRLSKAKNV